MIRYLSLAEFAERCGLTLNTMKGYQRKGLLPPPDAQIGRNRGWLTETVDHWHSHRLGRGHRTDLHPRDENSGVNDSDHPRMDPATKKPVGAKGLHRIRA